MTSTSNIDRQAELETRAAALSDAALKTCRTVRDWCGDSKEWLLNIGPFSFILIPFLREWWWYDSGHEMWSYTGFKSGEVRFVYDGKRLNFAPADKVHDAIDGTPLTSSPSSDSSKLAAVRRFCPSCGARVEPSWRFCQSCGEKLPDCPATS